MLSKKTELYLFLASLVAVSLVFIASTQATDQLPVAKLSVPASPGQTALSLNTDGFEAGQRIVIQKILMGYFEIKTIASVDSRYKLTLTEGLEYSYGYGSTVAASVLNPVFVSFTSNILGEPTDIYVSGNYAYVVSRQGITGGRLEIYNVSKSLLESNLVLAGSVSTDAGPRGIYVSNNYAYVVNQDSNTLQVFDVSDQTNPVQAGYAKTDSAPFSVHVSGNYVYVVNINSDTLQVFNIANPVNPILVKTIKIDQGPRSVYISGNYLYALSEAANTLQIFNILNPANPEKAGSVATGRNPYSVHVSGNYAYVAGHVYGLQIFDVSNPASPVEMSSVDMRTHYLDIYVLKYGLGDVYVSGNYAYVANTSGIFRVFDISNPAEPELVGINHNGAGYSVFASNQNVYIISHPVNGRGSLTVFNVSGLRSASATELSAAKAVMAEWDAAAVFARSITNKRAICYGPASPPAAVDVKKVGFNHSAGVSFEIKGQYSYSIGGAPSRLMINDISDPAQLRQVSSAFLRGTGIDIEIFDNHAYVVASKYMIMGRTGGVNILQIFDIFNPAKPVETGSVDIDGQPTWVEVSGKHAFVGSIKGQLSSQGIIPGSEKISIIDISNPSNPIFVSSFNPGIGPRFADLSGKYIYVLDYGDVLKIFDISNPTNPVLAGSVNTGSGPNSVHVSGDYAYITTFTDASLQIFNVSNPAEPQLIGTAEFLASAFDAYVWGDYIYVTVRGNIRVLDISNPANPVEIGRSNVSGAVVVFGVYASDNFVYGNYNGGLGAFDLCVDDEALAALEASRAEGATELTPETAPVAAGPEPVLINTTDIISDGTPANPWDIKVSGGHAFVTGMVPAGQNSYGVLKVFNISNAAEPIEVASVRLGGFPFAIDIKGQYAYVTNRQTNVIHVFDISNPNNPVEKNLATTDAVPYDIQASGNYLYVLNLDGRTFQVFDISTPLNPVLVSSAKLKGYSPKEHERAPSGLHAAGGYLYIVSRGATGSPGILHIFDISNPLNPVEKSSINTIADPFNVFVSGDYAFVDGAQVFDVSNPENPKELGKMLCQIEWAEGGVGGGRFTNIKIEDGLAYVSVSAGQALRGALCVFSMCDFETWPKRNFTSVATDNEPYFFDISGGHLYLTNSYGDKSLQVFDIYGCKAAGRAECPVEEFEPELEPELEPESTPPAFDINLLGSVGTGSSPQDVEVFGNYAYVTDVGSHVFQVFDVSEPWNPAPVSFVSTEGDPRSVVLAGNYAYVTNWGSNTLQVFDISNPENPRSIGSVGTHTGPWGIGVSGNYVYVTNYNSNTLQVFSISNPVKPASVGSVGTGLGPLAVDVEGLYAYVTTHGSDDPEAPVPSSIQVFNVSNPSRPLLVGLAETNRSPRSAAVSGDYAYVVNWGANTLQIFDVYDPLNPILVGSIGTGSNPRSVAVSGNYVFVANTGANTLQIFDASDPLNPALVDSVGTDNGPRDVAVVGPYAYVANTGADILQVFDLFGTTAVPETPAAPPALPEIPTAPPVLGELLPPEEVPEEIYCAMQYDPVCGADNRTYSNRCVAEQQNKVEVAYKGECKEADKTPPASVSDLETANPADSSLSLSWTAPGDDGNDGTATGYDARYSTRKITKGNWDKATPVIGEPAPITAGAKQSMAVSGLEPNTKYYFAIKTIDETSNESAISNIASGTTLAAGVVSEVTEPDGTVVTVKEDGTTIIKKPDGATVIEQPDGTIQNIEKDGASVTVKPGGETIIEEKDGTVTTVEPGGRTITEKPSGAVVTSETDGSIITEMPDGTTAAEQADGSTAVSQPDGTSINTESDGSVEVVTPIRTVVIAGPDKDTTVEKPDGARVVVGLDGTIDAKLPDGGSIKTDAGGTVVVTDADGTSVTADSNGNITVADSDGSVESVMPDKNKKAEVSTSAGTVVATSPYRTTIIKTDGAKAVIDPKDGTAKITTPDGTVISTKLDGTAKVKDSDGTTIVADSDGITIVEKPDGTTITTNTDGTVEIELPGLLEVIAKGIGKRLKKGWDFVAGVEGPRMTGGGTIGNSGAVHGFTLHCDAGEKSNNLEINWGKKGKGSDKFHLEKLDGVECGDNPDIDEEMPIAGFDTIIGAGTGRYNGVSGATVEFTFTDAGEPGKNDFAYIFVFDKDGKAILNVSGNLKNGNQQAHP